MSLRSPLLLALAVLSLTAGCAATAPLLPTPPAAATEADPSRVTLPTARGPLTGNNLPVVGSPASQTGEGTLVVNNSSALGVVGTGTGSNNQPLKNTGSLVLPAGGGSKVSLTGGNTIDVNSPGLVPLQDGAASPAGSSRS